MESDNSGPNSDRDTPDMAPVFRHDYDRRDRSSPDRVILHSQLKGYTVPAKIPTLPGDVTVDPEHQDRVAGHHKVALSGAGVATSKRNIIIF